MDTESQIIPMEESSQAEPTDEIETAPFLSGPSPNRNDSGEEDVDKNKADLHEAVKGNTLFPPNYNE